jgi:hypothetical protein
MEAKCNGFRYELFRDYHRQLLMCNFSCHNQAAFLIIKAGRLAEKVILVLVSFEYSKKEIRTF